MSYECPNCKKKFQDSVTLQCDDGIICPNCGDIAIPRKFEDLPEEYQESYKAGFK